MAQNRGCAQVNGKHGIPLRTSNAWMLAILAGRDTREVAGKGFKFGG
jgi:hypothetical protein